MIEKRYVGQSGGMIRLKIVHVKEARVDAVFSKEELRFIPQLVEAFDEVSSKASTDVYPREFEMLNPAPVVVAAEAEKVQQFVELVRARSGKSLYENAVYVEVDDEKYFIAVEHHCG